KKKIKINFLKKPQAPTGGGKKLGFWKKTGKYEKKTPQIKLTKGEKTNKKRHVKKKKSFVQNTKKKKKKKHLIGDKQRVLFFF
ncbi:hypothetical protein, partial [Limosilactobacillus reuteri]|uniref:hypothetical protein n=1 Tax=Limosilactobacillus reuteri TaxID=1598 RepID=UPI00159F344B